VEQKLIVVKFRWSWRNGWWWCWRSRSTRSFKWTRYFRNYKYWWWRWRCNGSPGASGGAGGSGIVVVKELNKASGVWNLKSQLAAKQQGTWPRFILLGDYLVVAGGGGSVANRGGGGGAGGYRASGYGPSPLQGDAIEIAPGPYTITVGGGGSAGSKGNDSSFSCITSTGGGAANGFLSPVGPDNKGGSGIVIVRAPSAATFSVSPCTNTSTTTPGGCKVATFTVSGTLTVS
jgi:hypothetical protein